MKKTLHFSFLLISIILLSSCAQKFYIQDAYSNDSREKKNSEEQIDIQVDYVADAFDYLIFEIEIENKTESDYIIRNEDILLYLYEKGTEAEQRLPMLDKGQLLYDLSRNRASVIQEKKVNTTVGIVSAGLNLLSFAFTPGLSGIEAVFYSIESASYILEDRRQYNLIQGDIEEQMQYIEDWIIDEEIIEPGQKISYDLLFERTLIDADAIMEISLKDEIKSFGFDFFVKEEKR